MEDKIPVEANELSRREFLRLAIISSAMLMATGSMLEGAETLPHALLRDLPAGAVRPDGWLRTMLEKQAAGLGSKLPQVSWPFNRSLLGRRGEVRAEEAGTGVVAVGAEGLLD